MVHIHEAEPFKNLCHKHVKYLVDLDQVQEKKINHVREETSALAEVLMLENCKYLCQHRIKAFIALQYFINRGFF